MFMLCLDQLKAMRQVMQGDATSPKATMGNNYRMLMPINSRTVRTNIDFHSSVSLSILFLRSLASVAF
jgi:hypothetical protein